MTLRLLSAVLIAAAGLHFGLASLSGQGGITGRIVAGDQPRIAVPDFRGKGGAQPLANVFNETVWNDLADAGVLDLVPKTNYPLETPDSPADFRPPTVTGGQTIRNGMWLTDWSNPPVGANYLAIGHLDVNGQDLVLRGWMLNVGLADLRTAQVFGNTYFGPFSEAGARKVAHEYTADILKQMGYRSLAGTKIYFVSDRTGNQEIWSMDHDGQNQQRMTSDRTISKMPAVSPDGKLVAYATMQNLSWQIRMINTETRRRMPFVNPAASTIATPSFSPDGQRLWFSLANNDYAQIVHTAIDGGGLQRVTSGRSINVSPRVNPRTGAEVLYISGRNGPPQLYKMNLDGSGVELLTDGTGEVANPSWSPDGRKIAFAWTRGYDPGNFNIFVMDAATHQYVQLTRQNGSNENPYWAPDGVHLVFTNTRGRNTQIYTMLANGTRVKQLTSQGNNLQPVWAAATN
jgi:TolB protein